MKVIGIYFDPKENETKAPRYTFQLTVDGRMKNNELIMAAFYNALRTHNFKPHRSITYPLQGWYVYKVVDSIESLIYIRKI